MRQKTLEKIILAFRENISQSFTIHKLAKTCGIGYRPAYNHVQELIKQDILKAESIGKATVCKLNLESEKCRSLLAHTDILRLESAEKRYSLLKKVLPVLTENLTKKILNDLLCIVLFGSYAKGKAVKGSDIDLFFIVRNMKNKRVRDIIEDECVRPYHRYDVELTPIISDLKSFEDMLKAKGYNVGKATLEGVSLFGGELFWKAVARTEKY